MAIPKHIRDQLMQEHGDTCPVCGRVGVPLHLCHLIPFAQGGSDDISNLAVMCPSCHVSFARHEPTEVEFSAFLFDLLSHNPNFAEGQLEPRISKRPPLRGDICVKSTYKDRCESILVECKRPAFFTDRRLRESIAQIDMYRSTSDFTSYVLAFPGRISPDQREVLRNADIGVWDVDFIASTFADQIRTSPHPYFKGLLLSITPVSSKPPEVRLLDTLKACPAGKSHWADYQRVVGQILERLFCPPLDPPISESADEFKVNRRDWIFPNYADSGFWRFLRDLYNAEYILVDAKNYNKPISKAQVLQIANYLKPHGAGLFAIIASRAGADKGAKVTIREKWMSERKMILVLTDEDMEAMLLSASAGGEASRVIGQLIQDFRLAM